MARIVVNEALGSSASRSASLLRDLAMPTGLIHRTTALPDGSIPAEVIYEQIRLLPDGYRTVFNLYVVEGFSHRQIGDAGNLGNTSASSCRGPRPSSHRDLKNPI